MLGVWYEMILGFLKCWSDLIGPNGTDAAYGVKRGSVGLT